MCYISKSRKSRDSRDSGFSNPEIPGFPGLETLSPIYTILKTPILEQQMSLAPIALKSS